jgi:hypothetical protein
VLGSRLARAARLLVVPRHPEATRELVLEVVAEVGRTGFAPAPHLHFEWRENGWNRDPQRVLLRRDRAPR